MAWFVKKTSFSCSGQWKDRISVPFWVAQEREGFENLPRDTEFVISEGEKRIGG
jgi:hypothetical protein